MSAHSLRERKARPTSFAAIAKEVDAEDDDLILHRRERLIPLSKSPFYDKNTIKYRELREQRNQTSFISADGTPAPLTYAGMLTADEIKDMNKSNDQQRGERPPAWLDLFYDLAWASTFSNLTQNNTITGGKESFSYAVFFSMVWWMWVSQVSYDIRFYSNDWFHRIFVFLQLCIFGALSAFTNKFDVTAYIGSEDSDPFQKKLDEFAGVSVAQQAANETAEKRYPELSFFGVAFIIGISRALLSIQYIRVWLYAPNKRNRAVLFKPLAMLISTGLWFGSFGLLYSAGYTNRSVQTFKFVIWGVATAVEVAGHAFAPSPDHLRSMGSLSARLATLVTIILGEGLNAITGTLKFAVRSLGFSSRSGGLVLATAVVVYLTFYLYFEGTRPKISKNRRPLWICLHLPYMLCLILLLEGLKNLLLYSILYNSYEFVINTSMNNFHVAINSPNPEQVLNSTMTPFLAKIGFSWDFGWRAILSEVNANTSTVNNKTEIELYRLLMNITIKVFEQFEYGDPGPEGQFAILNYLRNDSVVALDVSDPDGFPNFMHAISVLAQPQVTGARWISALAGGVLIFLAFINIAQEWPKDRYAWGSVLSRFTSGCVLFSLLLMNLGSRSYDFKSSNPASIWKWLDSYWTLPTLALSFGVQAIIDQILLVLSVRSADRELERTYQPSLFDPLRDHKGHAYDPPTESFDYTAGSSTTELVTTPSHQEENWQPAYSPSPSSEESEGTVTPPSVVVAKLHQSWARG